MDALCLLPDRPYANAWGNNGHARRLDTLALGRELRALGLRSHNLRINGDRAKRYELADFTDAFAKLLPNPPSAPATSLGTPNSPA